MSLTFLSSARWVAAISLTLLSCGCGAKKDGTGGSEPVAKAEPVANAEPAKAVAPAKRPPHGHAAYSGKATTGVEGMGKAPDAQIKNIAGE